ncbi:DEKNAAC105256 [Brettanomyces naardenensis]|uniref:DEKNAAC105256 n=1 Tax=Brettanomyces naardenensis TaxID=13370 RepID=A0A448YSX8_BRENA|nr:DEKNAAC105256 [Brettanomyces naardenensis]
MVDDTLYITPHEAALAVVATAMKKARLRPDTLFIDAAMGAILFSTGGMLYVMCESLDPGLISNGYSGIVALFQGAVYALGLFFVIQTGMELFNSNVLFFTVGLLRGAVSIMDLVISWTISFWVNLAATLFVVYVVCYLGGILKDPAYVEGTVRIAQHKIEASFMETFIRGLAGNFCVCLGTYLQIMVKPPHVKFLMIFLPIFTFVAMGFTHVVADMFLVPAGIFNHCGYGFGRYFWKIMLPGALGNIIGGVFFALVIPWYLHIVVIEQDMKKLNLPAYEEKDEQPMLNMDSRVVRVVPPMGEVVETASSGTGISMKMDTEEKDEDEEDGGGGGGAMTSPRVYRPRTESSTSGARSTISSTLVHFKKQVRSPKGVFPVIDMGPPLKKEKSIAYRGGSSGDDEEEEEEEQNDGGEAPYDVESNKMSTNLMRVVTRARTKAQRDIESIVEGEGEVETTLKKLKTKFQHASSHVRRRGFSFSAAGGSTNDASDILQRLERARIHRNAANYADPVSGIHQDYVNADMHKLIARRMTEKNSQGDSSVQTLTPAMYGDHRGREGESSRNGGVSRRSEEVRVPHKLKTQTKESDSEDAAPQRASGESFEYSENPVSIFSDSSFENGYRKEEDV